MNGFKAEPGERRANARSICPARASRNNRVPPTWARTSPEFVVGDDDGGGGTRCRSPAPARGPSVSSDACRSWDRVVSISTAPPGGGLRQPLGHMGRQHRKGQAAPWGSLVPRASAWSMLMTPAMSSRASTRSRAAFAAPPGDPDAAAPAPAELRPEAPLPPSTGASAPCRNRQARRRACLRYCRHREQAPDRDRGFRAWTRSLDLDGADHLGELVGEGALGPRFEKSCHLHGQRRAARNDAAVPQRLPERAEQGHGIDAGVFKKRLSS